MQKTKDIVFTSFFLVLISVTINLWWNVRLILRTSQVVVGKVSETATQINRAAQAVQSTFNSQKEQIDSPDLIRARRDSQLGLAALTNHIAHVTAPQIDSNLLALEKATNGIVDLGESLKLSANTAFGIVNSDILPGIAATTVSINKIAESVNISQAEVSASINRLIKTGTVTEELVNQRLLDPKFDTILSGAIELERDAHATLGHVEGISKNLEDTTAPLPDITKKTAKWQTVFNSARLISILMTIFRPY